MQLSKHSFLKRILGLLEEAGYICIRFAWVKHLPLILRTYCSTTRRLIVHTLAF